MAKELEAGDKAPDFNLPSSTGENISLKSLKGKTVVLYFYPKDDTPGCTKEACGFRDELSRFNKASAVILGVSNDSPDSHRKFIEKYSLTFPLLSDEDHSVSDKYGVYKEKNMYGKKYWGIERSTFVINPEGKIKQVFRKVKVDDHIQEVLNTLA
ncbi:MAG: thioredoxin-dependent thiol peroxidase [Nitrospiria bacterium]